MQSVISAVDNNNGQQWTTSDNNGQQWISMDYNGQQSAVLHASLMAFLYLVYVVFVPSVGFVDI